MIDVYKEVDLQDCPRCNGPAYLEEENGCWYYVICNDCGCHTAEVRFRNEDERLEAAKMAAHLWNIGKTMSSEPGE